MLHMCVCMHSRFVENHPIWVLEDGLIISEVVLSHTGPLLRCISKAASKELLVEIHSGICRGHIGSRAICEACQKFSSHLWAMFQPS
jgi:hypothetical protein